MSLDVEITAKTEKTSREDGWAEMTSEAICAAALASAPRNSTLRHPVFRRVYLVYFVFISLFILLPFWCIIYLPRSNRPRPTWSLQRCLRVRWSRRLCGVVARCEIDYLGRNLEIDMDPSQLQHSHPVTIPPAPSTYLRGHPAATLAMLHHSQGNWAPHFIHRPRRHEDGVWGPWNPTLDSNRSYGFEPVKAFWFTGKKMNPEDGPRPRNPGQAVILHFHGGGYLCGTAAETDLTSQIPKHLVVHSPIHHVLSVDYRLAPRAPWPLPLLDAISAYHFLVKVEGVSEKDIVVGGDSAGGHLAIALTRWIRDEGAHLGLKGPKGMVVMSPWTDVGFTNQWGEKEIKFNEESDTVDNTFGPFATSLLLRSLPASIMHESPYLSPSSLLIPTPSSGPGSLEGYPPTFVVYGGAERLANEIKIFWSRLQLARKLETDTPATRNPALLDKLVEGPDAVHDFMIFPWMAEEAAEVYETLDDWLRGLLSAEDEDEQEEEEEVVECTQVEPASPELSTTPGWESVDVRRRRRDSRRLEKTRLKIGKSPVLGPVKSGKSVLSLVEDLQKEGMSYIDLPPLDLDFDHHLPSAESAREWFTPFTSQYERGEWDWEGSPPDVDGIDDDEVDNGDQREWYEVDGIGSGSGSGSGSSPSGTVSESDGDDEESLADIEDIEPIEYEMNGGDRYKTESKKDI